MKIIDQNEMTASRTSHVIPFQEVHAHRLPIANILAFSKNQAQNYQKRKARKVMALL
jgi:hypothetical protein